jgi:hypothetical protein
MPYTGLMTIDQATSPDDLLTALASVPVDRRTTALQGRSGRAWLRLLQGAADLCGVDAVGLTRKQAIDAILGNF